MLEKWDGDLSVSPSPFEKRDVLLYTDYILTNPRTERKVIKRQDTGETGTVPEYNEIMFNFIRDAVASPRIRSDYKEILARHEIKNYQDMIIEVPDAGEVLLEAMLTVIVVGERVNPGNVAWAAEDGILGDILLGLRECSELS